MAQKSIIQIKTWGPWEPDVELRFAVSPLTSATPPKLQQVWVRIGFDAAGAAAGSEYQWRDVPTVVVQ